MKGPLNTPTERVTLTLTADERDYLKRRAELSDMTLTKYVRERLFYSPEALRAERHDREAYGIAEELAV